MDSILLKRFTTALSKKRLDTLVREMKIEGYSQLATYEAFSEFHRLWDAKPHQEDEQDHLLDIMDRICGWCSDKEKIFSEPLTNDAIAAAREQRRWNLEQLPEGWFYATPEESASLWKELQKELPKGHVLFHKRIQVMAHRHGATDDILCHHLDEPNRYTVVHLTWSMKTEINERFPTIEMDGSFHDFINYEKKSGWNEYKPTSGW
ncbi:MAG: hypothetical protein HZB51_20415 [Chloroflexi bacterium]|nr:hypothetical protein [Chloroflexota bacterium]